MRPTSARRSFVLLFLDSAFLFFLSYCLYYYVYSLRSPSGEWAGNKQLAQRRIITITWCRHLYDICLSFSFLFSHQRWWWAPWLRDRGRLAGLAIDVVHVRCVLRTTWKLCSCSQRIFYYYIVVGDVCCCFSAGREKKEKEESKLVALRLIESFPVQKANGVRWHLKSIWENGRIPICPVRSSSVSRSTSL